jgi:hypothetical protein
MRLLVLVAFGTVGALISVPIAFAVYAMRRRRDRNRVIVVRPALRVMKGGKG